MPIRTQCPKCNAGYHVPDAQLGKRVRCKSCAEVFTVTADDDSTAPLEPMDVKAVVPTEPMAPVQPPAPPPRMPRRLPRRPQQEEKESSSGAGVAVAICVVLGTVLLLGGASFGAYWFLIRSDYDKQPAVEYANKQSLPNGEPGGGPGFNPGQPPTVEMGPEGAERLTYEPRNLDQLEAGPRTLHPETPVPELPDGDKPKSNVAQLPPDVLKKVKAATALLRVVTAEGGQGEGTGFLALESGVMVTNAHVVGMVMPNAGKPRQVEVVFNSGERDERVLTAQVLGVDRKADLAVLLVRGDKLPEPLRVDSSRVLFETQPVFVSGFPGGSRHSRNISVTPTAVDSLHKEEGSLERVQVRGAMLPGNSGGPVVDNQGHVVGVSVAIQAGQDGLGRIVNSGINYAVPSDKVHYLLNGRLAELSLGYPQQAGNEFKVAVRGELFDPRGHIKQLALEWWIGDTGDERPPSMQKPESKPGDEVRNRVALKFSGEAVTGELKLPPPPPGKVLWLQPTLAGKDGAGVRWATAYAYQTPPVLQDKTLTLAKKDNASSGSVDLTSRTAFAMQVQGRQARPLSLSLHARLEEAAGSSEAGARRFTNFDLGLRSAGQSPTRAEMRGLLLRRTQAQQPNPENVAKLPAKTQQEAQIFNGTIDAMIQALDVPLPGEIKPRQTWMETRSVPLDHLFATQAQHAFDVKYTYLGVLTRNGKEEAVINLDGTASGNAAATGKLRGTAWVDIATGVTTLARVTVDYDLANEQFPFEMGAFAGAISGKVDVRLQRPAGKDAKDGA